MQSRVLCRVGSSSNSLNFLFYNLWYRFSAGVGRAGTFCVIYTAIRELNGTGNMGKDSMRITIVTHSFLLSKYVVNYLSFRRTVSLCHALFSALREL